GVRIHRNVERPILIALLGGIGEMLTPVLDPFHRAPRELRRSYDGDVFGIDAELWTEATPDVGSCHPHPALVESKQKGEGLEEVMRFLRRGPYGDCPIGVPPLRQDATPFYRMGPTTVLPELLVKDMRGFREGGANVPVGDTVACGEIGVQLAANR